MASSRNGGREAPTLDAREISGGFSAAAVGTSEGTRTVLAPPVVNGTSVQTMQAVVLAGGKGTRLRPYTHLLPKPLMPVGDLPVIEMLLKWLRRSGVRKSYLTVGYLGHLIRAVCGDGTQWGMDITYSEEPEPLGTIGPLRLLKDELTDTFLVLNGDLITDLNLSDFVAFHKEKGGPVTVAVTEKAVKLELGVLESDQGRVSAFREKPTMKFQVSMGIYCIEPSVLQLIPRGIPFGFDDLMYALLAMELPVYLFKHSGLWIDIGREEDYRTAQETFLGENQSRILGA